MPAVLSDPAKALVDAPEFATLATIDPDGRPQLSVIWVKRDGDDVLFSTIRGRRKTDNLLRDARCTLLVYPAADPYRYLEIRGRVTMTDDPTAALIDELNTKYRGDLPFGGPREGRLVVRLSADKVYVHSD